jgi:hypothetical protein
VPYVIAIDPGGTTGIAFRYPGGQIATSTVNTQEALWAYFENDMPKPDHVIIEEWQYFSGAATPSGVHTASLVSSVHGICYVLGIPLSLRSPGSRRPKMEEATKWYKAKVGKKYTNKMDSHEIDALAHLLQWESQHQHATR